MFKNVRFGWIDFIDDPEVSSALIKTVEDWGKNEAHHIAGPLDLPTSTQKVCWWKGSTNSARCAPSTTIPYYPVHMEKLGFEKDADWVEYKIYIPDAIPDKHKAYLRTDSTQI